MTDTYQPNTKNNTFQSNAPDDNNGGGANFALADLTNNIYRVPMTFNISASGYSAANIDTAVLSVYYHTLAAGSSATGKGITVYKLRRTDWHETQSTWNIYKTGSNWTTAGASDTTYDIDTSLTGSANMPSVGNWLDIDITDIVKDAITNNSSIIDILIRFTTENLSSNWSVPQFYARAEATETTLRPKLAIELIGQTISVSESPSFTESFKGNITFSKSENIEFTESLSIVKTIIMVLSEIINFTETLSAIPTTIWRRLKSKPTTTWTNKAKPTTTWTQKTKPSSTWTYKSKT